MDKATVIEIAKKYKEIVSVHLPIKEFYLFGSYSTGCNREDSDIDIAVIVPRERDNWLEDAPLLWKLSRKINTLIEPILLNEGDISPIYETIAKTGIKI